MIKQTSLIILILLFFSINLNAQSYDWTKQTNDNIFSLQFVPNKIILAHGINGTTKVVRSKRISSDYFSITALDDITGEKKWEIKDPLRKALSDKKDFKIETLEKNPDYLRLGHLLIVNSKDGAIIFNPEKEGITSIFSSIILPEGIIADVSKSGVRSYLFLSFSSWNIEWEKKNTSKLENGKKFAIDFSAGRNDAIKLTKSLANSLQRGTKINDTYIVNIKKNKVVNLNVNTGVENWKYESKNTILQKIIVQDPITKRAIVYLNTKNNRSKSSIVALDFTTGNLLWEKKIKDRIDHLKGLHESMSVLAFPATNGIGKKYYQIYNEKGEALIEGKSLKAFGYGIRKIVKNDNYLIIITNSNQRSNSPTGFANAFTKTQYGTKSPEFINVLNLETKKFIFDKRVKTNSKVKVVEVLEKGLFILENDQAYIIDYKTGKKIGGSIASKTKLIVNEFNENELYIVQEDAKYLFRVDKKRGEIKEIAYLRKTGSKISFISDLILLEKEILLYGVTKRDNLAIVKLDYNGNLIYSKIIPFTASNYQKSWTMPIVNNKIHLIKSADKKGNKSLEVFDINDGEISNSFSYDIRLEGKLQQNSGKYFVNPKNGMIYHTPALKVKNGFQKKRREFNSKGIILAKQFN